MNRVFVTGDCHTDYTKFANDRFKIGKELDKEDFVIVCGDFGLWHDTPQERYWFDWLNDKPWRTLFVDGNHENYDRLYYDFDVDEWHGGKVHFIRDDIIHLMRGQVFDIADKKFFTFGGAKCHDIQDGVLDPESPTFKEDYKRMNANPFCMFRVNHVSWWKEEEPTAEEIAEAWANLKKHNNKVDYIITHEMPYTSQILAYRGAQDDPYELVEFLDEIKSKVEFKRWYCGHHHADMAIDRQLDLLYDSIIEITDDRFSFWEKN